MNCYADLVKLKQRLESSGSASEFGTDYDIPLLELLNATSRQIDRFCNRKFYVLYGTKYFDGSSDPLNIDDLLSIDTSGFDLDEDADATYSSAVATTDYYLYPYNEFPKTKVKISPNGDYGGFAGGIKKGVRIVGNWGYGESATPYSDSEDEVEDTGGITATATSITVADADNFSPGQTILIESEQCYISAYDTTGNTITVTRAVNGTTGATHAKDKTIYIYVYPGDISEACLIQTMRWWKRKDTAFADVIGVPELGAITAFKGLDPDVKLILNGYRKIQI